MLFALAFEIAAELSKMTKQFSLASRYDDSSLFSARRYSAQAILATILEDQSNGCRQASSRLLDGLAFDTISSANVSS